ncbi:hypothetical protein ACFZAR_36140 [Streptomyces sp. NPDC008222]|uniref:hypothetical protein n=1 Tax=Streptomyces sp. NPDC008222 TaxID=3364820 RepID=UPI0036E09DF2
MLTRLIRAKDGDDVTVETLARDYDEGEKALTKAMRMLVEDAYVVKFKIQRATTETVVENGVEVVKRGGSWYTTFSVDSIPFTADDVAAMLEDIYAEGNVKSHRVEPTRLDPRHQGAAPAPRPTPPKGGVGATCGNDAKPQVRPTPPSPGVGQGGAHIRKETSYACAEIDETGDALSARSAGDGRRPSDGSSACAREGGSAASSKDHPTPDHEDPQPRAKTSSKAKHTREQLDTARQVCAFFPAELRIRLVPVLTQAILDALDGDVPGAGRTVEQLGARIQQRWNHHGYASAFYAGELTKPIGAAVEMVRPLKATDRYGCGNPRCEVGKDVDTGVDCHVCPERLAVRRAARRNGDDQVPSPRPGSSGPVWWECETPTCGKPVSGPRSASGLCPDCDAELERAAALLMAGSPTAEPEPAPALEQPFDGQEDAVDEETIRLRAALARQFGTPDQVEAYCTNAPF